MSDDWIELHIPVPAAAVDIVCGELHDLGCAGITVGECVLDAFVPPDPDEVIAGDRELKAYFPPSEEPARLCREVSKRLEALSPHFPALAGVVPELKAVGSEDWAQNWKQHFTAVRIGRRLVVKPSWEAFAAGEGDVMVTLDPGMAFGTGTHGTTRLCLEALAALFDRGERLPRVLDVGTGSGILAIAAAALGSQRVLACDIDEESCRVAEENVSINGVDRQVEVTQRGLETLEDRFDVVIANILAEENVRLADELVRRVAPGGWLILSGILREKETLVSEGFAPYFASGPRIQRQDDWSCLVYRKER